MQNVVIVAAVAMGAARLAWRLRGRAAPLDLEALRRAAE